jgi:hypothetical protein
MLEAEGFVVPANQIVARNENSYIQLNLHYKSYFAAVASLRTEIKLEFNARPPLLPTLPLPISSMLDVLLKAPKSECQIECISVEETLAEKVLSFLRRTAEASAGRNRADYDDRLVRHLYDVYAIVQGCDDLRLPHQYFATMIAGDAVQFRNQYPEFEQNPIAQIKSVLDALQWESTRFERDYQKFVDELVFGAPVMFNAARKCFIDVAKRLINELH